MAIYFVQAGEGGPVKIGFARNIRLRMNKMRSDNQDVSRITGIPVEALRPDLAAIFNAAEPSKHAQETA